jgi:hypothetical protein
MNIVCRYLKLSLFMIILPPVYLGLKVLHILIDYVQADTSVCWFLFFPRVDIISKIRELLMASTNL